MKARRSAATGRAADVPVGDAMIAARSTLSVNRIDGLGPIETTERRPIEREASGVVSREPVKPADADRHPLPLTRWCRSDAVSAS